MVNSNTDALDAAFAALSDATRRAIVERLVSGPATVGELAAPFDMSLPAVSKHVSVLERAGLVDRQREGRVRRCSLRGASLERALLWMDTQRRFWESRLDALARLVEAPTEKENTWKHPRPTRSGSNASSPRRARRSSGRGRKPRRS